MFFKQKWNVLIIGTLMTINVFSQETIDTSSCLHSCHCFRNLTPAGVMISHVHPKKEWMLSYRYMQMNNSTLISGNSPVDEMDVFNEYVMSSNKMNMQMHMLMGMYGFSERFTGMLMVHYNQTSMGMTMVPTMSHDHSMPGMEMTNNADMTMLTSGIGDTKLHLLYGIVKNTSSQLILGLGGSIPTGSIQMKGLSNDMLYPNERFAYMMQMGTGSFELLPSLTYIKQSNGFAYSFQGSSVMRLNTNNIGYRLGNEYYLNVWGAYNWWNNFSSSIRFEGKLIDAIQGYDKTIYRFNEPSSNTMNYGLKSISTLVGLSYQISKGFFENVKLNFEYGFPIYQYVDGIQNKSKNSLIGSISYSF
jgi:hypothetical protein